MAQMTVVIQDSIVMVHAYDLALGRQEREDQKFKASIGWTQSLRTAFDTEGRKEEMKEGKEGKGEGRKERGREEGRFLRRTVQVYLSIHRTKICLALLVGKVAMGNEEGN